MLTTAQIYDLGITSGLSAGAELLAAQGAQPQLARYAGETSLVQAIARATSLVGLEAEPGAATIAPALMQAVAPLLEPASARGAWMLGLGASRTVAGLWLLSFADEAPPLVEGARALLSQGSTMLAGATEAWPLMPPVALGLADDLHKAADDALAAKADRTPHDRAARASLSRAVDPVVLSTLAASDGPAPRPVAAAPSPAPVVQSSARVTSPQDVRQGAHEPPPPGDDEPLAPLPPPVDPPPPSLPLSPTMVSATPPPAGETAPPVAAVAPVFAAPPVAAAPPVVAAPAQTAPPVASPPAASPSQPSPPAASPPDEPREEGTVAKLEATFEDVRHTVAQAVTPALDDVKKGFFSLKSAVVSKVNEVTRPDPRPVQPFAPHPATSAPQAVQQAAQQPPPALQQNVYQNAQQAAPQPRALDRMRVVAQLTWMRLDPASGAHVAAGYALHTWYLRATAGFAARADARALVAAAAAQIVQQTNERIRAQHPGEAGYLTLVATVFEPITAAELPQRPWLRAPVRWEASACFDLSDAGAVVPVRADDL